MRSASCGHLTTGRPLEQARVALIVRNMACCMVTCHFCRVWMLVALRKRLAARCSLIPQATDHCGSSREGNIRTGPKTKIYFGGYRVYRDLL